MDTVLGVIVAAAAGLCMGSSAWSVKTLRRFQFEQWWFVGMVVGLVGLPWTVTLVAFPHVFTACRDVAPSALITSNLFSVAWGVANILCGMCYLRIGVALTGAILTGLGASVAVTLPMICKGSGLFKQAPDVGSPAGMTVLAGVGIMIVGVILASLAGFGRDRELKKLQTTTGSFAVGLIMTVIAGICSAGMSLAFVYSQGPIVARVSMVETGQTLKLTVAENKALTGNYVVSADGTIALKGAGQVEVAGLSAKAAADRIAGKLGLSQQPEADAQVSVGTNNILAVFPVNALALIGGALINIIYPAYLMTKKGTWGIPPRGRARNRLHHHRRPPVLPGRDPGRQRHAVARRAGRLGGRRHPAGHADGGRPGTRLPQRRVARRFWQAARPNVRRHRPVAGSHGRHGLCQYAHELREASQEKENRKM